MAAEASSRDALATKVVALRTAKVAARGGFLWGLVFGGTIAATMSTFHTSFPTAASRADLVRTIEGNAAFEAMFGLVRRMDTVAGYTAYKTTMTLVVLAAIWGLLIATRVLRGDEDTAGGSSCSPGRRPGAAPRSKR
jgi:ABC-2 type transport system permease protein